MGAIVLCELEPPGSFSEEEPVADIDVRHGPLEAVRSHRRQSTPDRARSPLR